MGSSPSRVVFLGPSLDSKEAKEYLEAEYLPPIRRGDLPRVIGEGAQAIGIVDGEFGQSLAVSVMEIAAGLRRGVRIWGAASMGALRAAECQSLGMVGVGWIFEKYSEGALLADDEVALIFDPRNCRATTIPLVNIRWTLQTAISAGFLTEACETGILDLARTIRYADRTFAALLESASGSPFRSKMERLVEYMRENPIQSDRKRLDAILLLAAMRDSNASIYHSSS